MKKKIIVAGVLTLGVALAIVFFLFLKRHGPVNESLPLDHSVIFPNGHQVQVRIAQSQKQREGGLSGFNQMDNNQGMLFLFNQPGRYPFWMKDMSFPLDIIWLIKKDQHTFQVVGIKSEFTPDSYPSEFDPGQNADAVLEINSGKAAQWGLDRKNSNILTFY
jgi:uncharacterized membrane protein (UPF0127 family)